MTNFIYQGHINHHLCDRIVEYHKFSDKKYEGHIGDTNSIFVDKDIKDSIDVIFDHNDLLYREYMNEMRTLVNYYKERYPTCNMYERFGIRENVNIQYYSPKGGYKKWHTERTSGRGNDSDRHLVFLTYLNDVSDGGGTQFWNQDITVNAKKGLTLIWPSDWTHTHRGIVSPTEEKYIVTGWFNYLDGLETE